MLARLLFLCLLAAMPAVAADTDEAEKRIVERANAFRKAQNLEAQAVDAALSEAATRFARFMAKTGKYGHEADGRTPLQRARGQGYEVCLILENIARVYRSTGYDAPSLARELVEGWKNSPPHRKNLLEPAATQTGAGVAQGADGRYYGVQMFGRPKSAAIRFTVRNEAGREIEYRAAGQAFTLPPRAVRTHSVCRPPELHVSLPGRSAPFTTRPEDGSRYTIVHGADGYTVTRR